MTKRRFAVWGLILALCTGTAGMTTAYAADKTISSVKLQIYTDLEVGDKIGDASIDIDSTTAPGRWDCHFRFHGALPDYGSRVDHLFFQRSKCGLPARVENRLEVADSDYVFKGTYRSSNVTIKGAEFVSASKSSGDLVIKAKLKPIKGTFEAPEDAYWKDNAKGTAKWEEPDNGGTGQYEVELRKGSTKIYTTETTSKTFNFYPYMTQAGTYTFRVRTIAKTSKQDDYGKNSEWIESDEIYLAKEDVSDGSGRNDNNTSGSPNGNTNAGWKKYDNTWYYYYPDGSYVKNGWVEVGGRWYLFDASGRMLTGWQERNGQMYYLDGSGAMITGWLSWNGRWCYMNETQDAYYGCLVRGHWLGKDGKDLLSG
ncbi:MAG: N-acetylmuramoyl-L-alanine amidase family protein [Lachnospiraceae bacterium]